MRDIDNRLPNLDEGVFFSRPRPRLCMTCSLANGEPPWADMPTKSYCLAYPRENGAQKPPEVYYEGGDCEHYRKAR